MTSVSRLIWATPLLPELSGDSEDRISLPQWLNDWLNGQGAFYQKDRPEQEKFVHNTGHFNNKEELQRYLGSYFPKSFTEAFFIYDDLFSHKRYKDLLQDKEEFNVLDIGCGTGGDTVGLIIAILFQLENIKRIRITACDANDVSLDSLNRLVGFFNKDISQGHVSIELETRTIALSEKTSAGTLSMADLAKSFLGQRFDAILSFKMFNELIRSRQHLISLVYSDFSSSFCPLLSDVGTIAVEDVCDRIEGQWTSYHLNSSINRFLRSGCGAAFCSISPLPCAIMQSRCEEYKCYMQRRLEVDYAVRFFDEENGRISGTIQPQHIDTLIVYRLLARKDVRDHMTFPSKFSYRYRKVYKREDAGKYDNGDDWYCGGTQDEPERYAFMISNLDD